MTHPQTIDTDALRKLCKQAEDFYFAVRAFIPAILDEFDRLRAAEAAGKARVEELERGAEGYPDECHETHDVRSSDASAYDVVCKNCGLHDETASGWGQLRKPCPARAEIARLADAGATAKQERELCTECHGNGVKRLPNGVEECSRCNGESWEPIAPFPPAAADRGVPGQRVSDETVEAAAAAIALLGYGDKWTRVPSYLKPVYLEQARAALATAPKAEDVRREAIEQCAKLCDAHAAESEQSRQREMKLQASGDRDADPSYYLWAVQSHQSNAREIRALADRPAQ